MLLFELIDKFMEETDTVVVLTRKPNGFIELLIRARDDPSLKRTEKFNRPRQAEEWLQGEINSLNH